MRKHWSTVLLIFVCLVGLALMLYPTVSDAWNRRHQSRAIIGYSSFVNELDDSDSREILEAAREYNRGITPDRIPQMTEEFLSEYNSQLDPMGNGIMGYIEIPSIQCSLPIYHGTEDSVLASAIGHINWSSLPVGGESTHCVVSGHRGLPSAKLFTRLDELIEGDIFMLKVLGETLTYEVDQILVVLPDEVNSLCVIEGQDLCTLVTCTPYGINTHRLLVRGHRVSTSDTVDRIEKTVELQIRADAERIAPLTVAAFIVLPAAFITIICFLASDMRKNRKR